MNCLKKVSFTVLREICFDDYTHFQIFILIFKCFLLKSRWDQMSIFNFIYIFYLSVAETEWLYSFSYIFSLYFWWGEMSIIISKYFFIYFLMRLRETEWLYSFSYIFSLYFWWGEVSIIIFKYFFIYFLMRLREHTHFLIIFV